MKIRLSFAVIALSLAPAIASAQGCRGDEVKAETASSCAPGSTWDGAKHACVVNPTS